MPTRSQRHMLATGRTASTGETPNQLGIRFSGFIAPENIALGANIGTLSTTGTTGTPVFTLTNSDGSRVALSGTAINRGATAWDYETKPLITFTVSVSGVTPTIAPTSFPIVVSNVLEVILAALTLSASTIPENSPSSTVVGAVQGKTAGSTITLTDDAGTRFALSGTNLVATGAPLLDRESSASHSITIRETHPDAAPRDTTLSITVSNVLEITLATLAVSPNAVNENVGTGTLVGAVTGTTSGSTLALTGTGGGLFALSGTNIVTAAGIDYELTGATVNITLQETHPDGNNSPKSTVIPITIGDVFEAGPDSVPDAFTFVDQTGVALSSTITSNTITVTGINIASALTITGGTYSINGAAFASAATTVVNGDTVAVRVTSSGSNSTAVNATLTIGGVSDTFTATTLAAAAFGPFTLAWTSATNELTNLAFSVTPALEVGDVVVLTLSVNSNMSSPFATSAANTIDSAEAAAGSITFTGITTPLSTGLKYARVNIVRGASNADSTTASITLVAADTTAPVLSLPTGVKTGSTTATLTVTTDEANGTLYGVNSAAAPSKAQIKLGQTSTGAASTYAFNQAVSATGVQTKNATGLTAATSYTMHYMHEDAATNQSNVASASAFTTDAASGAWTSPLDATTPAVWWIDASNAASLTPASPTNGTSLTQVNDLGTGAHNMTPSGAGGAIGALYSTNVLNSKPGFGFDAARDMWTAAFTVPQPFMLVIIWRQSAALPSSFGILVDGDRTQAAAGRAIIFARRTDTSDQYCTYAGTSSVPQGVIAINTAYHSRIVFNGSSSSSVLNGSNLTGISPGTSGIVNGIMLAGTNAPFAHICEAFIIPYTAGNVAANSATDATNAAAYTLAKWGV